MVMQWNLKKKLGLTEREYMCVFFLFYFTKGTYNQGLNWGGMRGDGIPLVKKNDKKHPLCKTTIPLTIPIGLLMCIS